MSFVGELWQVYVLLAVSIALSGSGFGGAILSPIVSSLIVSVGWRSAFLVLAAICMVAALPSRVQAVWHGRPRQGHGHHRRQAACKRGGGVDVRRSFLFAPFCLWPPWKPNGCSYHHSVSKAATGLRNDPFSSVPKGSRDPKGTEENGSQTAAARLAERVPIPSFGQTRRRVLFLCRIITTTYDAI